MNKTNTPYELRAELLDSAIDIVTRQREVAYQTAIQNYHVAINFLHDIQDINNSVYQEAKKQVDLAGKEYDSILKDSLSLAKTMNEFVSSKS